MGFSMPLAAILLVATASPVWSFEGQYRKFWTRHSSAQLNIIKQGDGRFDVKVRIFSYGNRSKCDAIGVQRGDEMEVRPSDGDEQCLIRIVLHEDLVLVRENSCKSKDTAACFPISQGDFGNYIKVNNP